MKVTIINHSDSKGGAAVVMMRLLKALIAEGVDARMLVTHKGTNSPYVEEIKPKWVWKVCFLMERLQIWLHNGFSRRYLFKVDTASWGMPEYLNPRVQDSDAVILGWINQGTLSIYGISQITAPLIWTMHDMWNLTGICHHAGDCPGYELSCGHCPMLHKGKPFDLADKHGSDLSWRRRLEKAKLYMLRHIQFVAVSNWLKGKCAESSLMRSQNVKVIPNAFPVEDFYTTPHTIRAELGLPQGKRLIAMGAARLDDPIKGLPLAIEALNQLQGEEVAAVFFGSLREPSALASLKIPYVHLGEIDMDTVREVYAHADVVLSSSLYETLPGTLIEGMAAGCVPVTFGRGGQADIVRHRINGYIAQYPDTTDLAQGLKFALSGAVDPTKLPKAMEKKFSARAVAREYIRLINSMASGR